MSFQSAYKFNTPTNTSNNTHASITFVIVAIIEKQLEARNRIHNIDNIAAKPQLNKEIITSSCKLSKRKIFCPQCNATTEHYFINCFECELTIVITIHNYMSRNM